MPVPPVDNDRLIAMIQERSLSIALSLMDKIRSSQGSTGAEYPIELIKLMPAVLKAADELNGISLAASIERVTSAGYKITES